MIHTDDLYLGALALVRGAQLTGVEVRQFAGRRTAFFEIAGPGVEEARDDYEAGETRVDLRLFKFQVARLKNAAFDAIRREEERRSHASRYEGRGRSVAGGESDRRPRR